jgi:TRAP-type C4-dicarboxylate transport system substrate-binding protein
VLFLQRLIRSTIANTLISAAALTAAPQPSLAQEVQLRLQHFMPANSPQQTDLFLPWARRIEAASKGRMQVNIIAGMGPGEKPSDLLGNVERSEIDISWAIAGYTPGRFPKLSVFELP